MPTRILTRILTGRLAAVALTFSAIAAHADAPRLTVPLPKVDAGAEFVCPAGCFAQGADGTLLCALNDGGTSACDCRIAFIKPGATRVALTPAIACDERNDDQTNIPKLNRQAKGMQPAAALFEETFTGLPTKRVREAGGVTFTLDGPTLTVARDGQVIDNLGWGPGEMPLIAADPTTLRVYAFGALAKAGKAAPAKAAKAPETFLALITYKSDRNAEKPEPRWVVLGAPRAADPTPLGALTDGALRAPHDDAAAIMRPNCYAEFLPYLAHFCEGKLTPGELSALSTLALGSACGEDNLVAIYNMVGAMYGYRFKAETWLNPFYYAPSAHDWLPTACHAQVKTLANEGAVPAALRASRDAIKAIWKDVKAHKDAWYSTLVIR